MWIPLGRVTVPAAGTPRQFLAGLSGAQQSQLMTYAGHVGIHGILLQAWHENTGKIFIGTIGMNKADGTKVGAVLPAPTATFLPSFSMALTIAPNSVALEDLYLDADSSGEGVIASVLVT